MKIYISLLHFDWIYFIGVIALFHIEYFIKKLICIIPPMFEMGIPLAQGDINFSAKNNCLIRQLNSPRIEYCRFNFFLQDSVCFYFLVHLDQGPGELLPSLGFHRLLSVNFSHLKLLLRNHWANQNQTQQECSLDGPLQSFCFSFQSDIQNGCQGQ